MTDTPVRPARIILDVMGGDHAPRAVLEGAVEALPELSDPASSPCELVLVGDEAVVRPLVERRRSLRPLAPAFEGPLTPERSSPVRLRFLHSSQTIEMEDSIRAIRSKPDATINVGCRLAGEAFQARKKGFSEPATAFISAGHSGAVMASALLQMGRLPGIERPAIAVVLPTLGPNGCVLLDVGANVDCKPEHLRDFALMGAVYAHAERRTDGLPRVAVLSNGEERKKGNELTRAASALIEQLPSFGSRAEPPPAGHTAGGVGEFVGYAEGKDLLKGRIDVMVADGFVGNVVLKSLEGLGSAVTTILKKEVRSSVFTPLGFLLAAPALRRLKRKLDYAEYGAAPLLGVAGYAFICHGRSQPRAIKNAILRARSTLRDGFVERLDDALAELSPGGSAGEYSKA